MTAIATPLLHRSGLSAAAAVVRTEAALVRSALGVVALHVADDSWLQPNPGTTAGDHLLGGLVPVLLLVAAIVFYPRLRAGVRATIALTGAFFAGLVSTEAIHYTRAVGPSGDDFTGLLCIPACLLLVGVGIRTLWTFRRRDDSRWWRYPRRLLVAGTAAVITGFVLFPISIAYVVTHALRAHVPAANLGAPYENVEFRTSDGLLLKGWYIRSENGAAVISFPGRAGSQSRAKMLADHGYGVLLFDRRGEGESEGDPNLLGWQGERDIHAAVAYLQTRPDVDPERIGGVGLSVGGEMMIEAAAESTALKAIVTEGASGRSVRDVRANEGGSWDELLSTGVLTAATALFTDNVAPAPLESLVPKMSAAAFFIYGENGQPAEEGANVGFYRATRSPRQIWEVPGSGHMKGIEAQPEEYERRIAAFFDRTLRGRA